MSSLNVAVSAVGVLVIDLVTTYCQSHAEGFRFILVMFTNYSAIARFPIPWLVRRSDENKRVSAVEDAGETLGQSTKLF